MAAVDDVLDEIEKDYGVKPSPKAVNVVDDLIDHYVVIDNRLPTIKGTSISDIIESIIGRSWKTGQMTMNEETKRALRYGMMESMVSTDDVFYGLIGARNPEDDMVDKIEKMTGYSKEVTKDMIEITDGFLDDNVEVLVVGDSSDEEDINEAKDFRDIDEIIKNITKPESSLRKKMPVSEDTRNKLREEILTDMLDDDKHEHSYLNIIYSFMKMKKSKGGRKRRKKTKRSKKYKNDNYVKSRTIRNNSRRNTKRNCSD
jgi:hypothetical protein